MTTNSQIIAEITEFVRNNGGKYSDWYAGIAADVKNRLFNNHGVDEKNGNWIYNTAESSDAARQIEDYFIAQGMDRGPGGGDNSTTKVYAYKKTASTKE